MSLSDARVIEWEYPPLPDDHEFAGLEWPCEHVGRRSTPDGAFVTTDPLHPFLTVADVSALGVSVRVVATFEGVNS